MLEPNCGCDLVKLIIAFFGAKFVVFCAFGAKFWALRAKFLAFLAVGVVDQNLAFLSQILALCTFWS